jgi:hypothetical protein
VLGTINIVLITENADAHSWARDLRKADGSRETLVTLGIVVLEADLQLDGLEEVTLLGFGRKFKEFLDVGTHSGWRGVSEMHDGRRVAMTPSIAREFRNVQLKTYRL